MQPNSQTPDSAVWIKIWIRSPMMPEQYTIDHRDVINGDDQTDEDGD